MNTEHADQPARTITLKLPTELLEYVDKTVALEGPGTWAIINRFVQRSLLTQVGRVEQLPFQERANNRSTKNLCNLLGNDSMISLFIPTLIFSLSLGK